MGTEVIRPQDCLVNRMRDSPATIFHHPRRNHSHRRPPLRPDQRRRFGSVDFRTTAKDVVRRRGESFDSFSNIKARRSNAPEVSPDDIYAGSSIFLVSPAPSSLPLPSFSRRNAKSQVVVVSVDDSASQDLRRLLRLEFWVNAGNLTGSSAISRFSYVFKSGNRLRYCFTNLSFLWIICYRMGWVWVIV